MSEIDRTKLNNFIIEYFNDDEIHFLCAGDFRDVYNDFTNGMGKKQKVLNLTEWCYRHRKTADLYLILQRERPSLYETHFAQPSTPEVIAEPVVPAIEFQNSRINPISGKEMIRIPAGEFLYGDDKKFVYLDEFWMAKTAVTNAEFAKFVEATGHRAPEYWEGGKPPRRLLNHPVVTVSWNIARAYAEWAHCGLPMEQEWEKAARGINGFVYPWGDEEPTDKHCNFGRSVGKTTFVGNYSPLGDSPFGCVDMSGNVWEWTASWYDANKDVRILRGGAFINNHDSCRATLRYCYDPHLWPYSIGFRVVEHLSSSGS